MKFGKSQQIKFETEHGAYSVVTPREHQDSQITLTDEESNLIISYFGAENIQIGNVASDPVKASKPFKLYPEGREIRLNLVYPKPHKAELRLYIGTRAGFKPYGGEIWFLFERYNELWIGAMPEQQWRGQHQILLYDEGESNYQDSLQELDEIKITRLKERDVYRRDRRLALERLELARYRCEVDERHNLFISRATDKPYLEAHHLIPMSLQNDFNIRLDTSENIYCLCPNCHRAIHLAEKETTKYIIHSLVSRRSDILNVARQGMSDIFSYYAVEDID